MNRAVGLIVDLVSTMVRPMTFKRLRSYGELAEFVVESMATLGLAPRAGSRIWQMHRIMTKAEASIEPDDPEFQTFVEGVRDMQQLSFVFEQGHAESKPSGFLERVELVAYDSVLPQLDKGESKGRNAQFELHVAAVCQAADLQPVDYAEPDVTCTVRGTPLGIAAKRIKSEIQVRKRIKQAVEQIGRQEGLPGVVAVDITAALNPGNLRMAPLSDDVVKPWYKERMARFFRDYESKIRKWTNGTATIGFIAFDSVLRLEPGDKWSWTAMTMP